MSSETMATVTHVKFMRVMRLKRHVLTAVVAVTLERMKMKSAKSVAVQELSMKRVIVKSRLQIFTPTSST